MRWFWIDRFVEFEHGKRAVSEKVVSLSEDALDDRLPGFPLMPASLIVEGLAQTGGLLAGEYRGFKERVVLAKVTKAQFHFPAVPGDVLRYTATLLDIKPDGAMCSGTSHVGGRLQGEFELMFAHLSSAMQRELFEPAEFLRLLRILRLFEVGRKEDGSPLDVPEHLLAAERLVGIEGGA